MQIKSIKIGKTETPNNCFLAPLAGYTDFAFRGICSSYGAGLTFTEMVSAKGLVYGNKGTKELLIKTKKSVNEISELCGFSSANYFGLIFKQKEKLSPLSYRKYQNTKL